MEKTNSYTKKNIIDNIKEIEELLGLNMNKPTTILTNMNVYKSSNKENQYTFISNKNNENTLPLVYIYNTHDEEKYIGNQELNITPTVKDASNYLKEKLEQIGIKTIIETRSIKEVLNNNNWDYTQSYKASRIYLEEIKNQYPSIKIFIDLHRDAVPSYSSTIIINDKSYAKILFVIGKEHNNYKENLEYTKSINNIIESKYPTLTKGILEKEGIGVNGIYNQDLSSNIILMEVGVYLPYTVNGMRYILISSVSTLKNKKRNRKNAWW